MTDDLDDVGLSQYYNARAASYATMYAGTAPPWVQEMITALQTAVAGRRVLELACGTGHWTAYAADVAAHVTATDSAPNMLALARQHLHTCRNVTVVPADAYTLAGLTGDFTAGLAMQWLSHVPKVRLASFLARWHQRLGSGAVVFLGDNQRRSDDRDPLLTRPDDPNTYEVRTLPDGTTATIVKNYFTARS